MNGIIVKAIAGFYYVETGNAIYECKARGSFRRDGINPLVGDKVNFLESGIIDSVNPRKNSFTRPPIANLQQLFIISAFSNPAPNMLLIDRLISVAEQRSVEPIIVFNKSDMGDFSEIRSVYDKAGFKTFVVSCETEEGFEDMIKRLEGSISAFTGNSGVGKSSIL
ncbi:MAG: GTPase RsgA, partial [Oscillospiraceae bacterium]